MPDSYLENLRVTYTTLDKLADEYPVRDEVIEHAMAVVLARVVELEAKQDGQDD